MRISLFTSCLRNRAYSQGLQLVQDDWRYRELYNELVGKKGYTRPEAMEKVLIDMKHMRSEINKLRDL